VYFHASKTQWPLLAILLIFLAIAPAHGELQRRAAAATQTTTSSNERADSWDMQRVLMSLGMVILVILVLWWLSKRVMGSNPLGRGTRGVAVLCRSAIGPRQQVIVLQVGKRLVVVGSSGGQMNTLCQITDAQEVAELSGQIGQGKGDSITATFAGLFRGAAEKYQPQDGKETAEQEEVEPGQDQHLAGTRADLEGLMEKVRGLAKLSKG
jgi:flagellar biogenesis protein FliO